MSFEHACEEVWLTEIGVGREKWRENQDGGTNTLTLHSEGPRGVVSS